MPWGGWELVTLASGGRSRGLHLPLARPAQSLPSCRLRGRSGDAAGYVAGVISSLGHAQSLPSWLVAGAGAGVGALRRAAREGGG
jgi:hypothetical protein